MAENKTKATEKSVKDYVAAVKDETKRKDSEVIIKMMQEASGFKAKMWGPSIIGFGEYHYVYESGREGDMPLVCFSPRSAAIVFYLSLEGAKREALLKKFGKHSTKGGCVYVKKLADIDLSVLKQMIEMTLKNIKAKYPSKKGK